MCATQMAPFVIIIQTNILVLFLPYDIGTQHVLLRIKIIENEKTFFIKKTLFFNVVE